MSEMFERLEVVKKALAAMKPRMPLQLSDDSTRLETLIDLLENGTPQQLETLWPLLVQQVCMFFSAVIRLMFIENLFPMGMRMMNDIIGGMPTSEPTEDDVVRGLAELAEFLKENGGEATGSN